MNIQEEWLERFKAVVASEIDAARGRASDGYRAVASKTGLGYDYIYQIYNGKPAHKPKRPSAEAMDSIRRAYGDAAEGPATGKGEMLQRTTPDQAVAAAAGASGTVTLAQALEVVAQALRGADELSRLQAKPLLQRLIDHPEQEADIAPRLANLLGNRPQPAVETAQWAKRPSELEQSAPTKNTREFFKT